MRRFIAMQFLLLCYTITNGQEMFVSSYPASNNPAHSIVVGLNGKTMKSNHDNKREYRLAPEVEVGLSKNFMLIGGATFANMFFEDKVEFESAKLYAKYRVYSKDEVHKHFRIALYGTGSWSNNPLVYQELNLDGDNSGWQFGAVATQLTHKLATSAGLSYVQLYGNADKLPLGYSFSKNAVQYNLSAGYLVFPRTYNSYTQTNFNIYCELVGQKSTDLKSSFLDIAPAVQFIFNSNTMLNFGARFQLAGNAHRMGEQSFSAGLHYHFFNAWK